MRTPGPALDFTAPLATYAIGGKQFDKDQPGFADALAEAYDRHQRPLCLCRTGPHTRGIEMYVARLVDGYIVKRMPNTGSHHATECPSYEPPAELSGLGPLLGTAILENPATGETSLKLDFPLTKLPGRSSRPAIGASSDSTMSSGQRLTLRGLLHYLWDQAELTHWKPGFAGKRSWATVRKHLLQAAENKTARGQPLQTQLYIPEVFSVDTRDDIRARRLQMWAHAASALGQPQRLMLLVAEVKEIVPARYGYKAIVKHVPDQAFGLDEQLYRRLGRCFEPALALWGAAEDLRMVMIATFSVADAGIPSISALSLMPTTAQWLPIEDGFEQQLVETLVRDNRVFIKALRYNMPREKTLVSASLTDCGESPQPLSISRHPIDDHWMHAGLIEKGSAEGIRTWLWRTADGSMPRLPLKCHTPSARQPLSVSAC